jgi:SnoaL-like domain
MSPRPEAQVLHYLDRMVAHDWTAVTECLHPEVVRVGPFGDTFTPRGPYVAFLSSLLPSLVGYALTVERTLADGSQVVVQLTESMEIGGTTDVTHEALVFDTDPNGQITRIDIYIQRDAT